MDNDPEFVVRGARLFFGLIAALILCLVLMFWAAFGSWHWDFQMPCPKQEQTESQ